MDGMDTDRDTGAKRDGQTNGYTDRDRDSKTDRETYVERLDTDEFSIAGIVVVVWHGPLQRKKVAMVDLDVILSILGNGLLLSQTNAAVLQRCKDGRWNIVIITLQIGI